MSSSKDFRIVPNLDFAKLLQRSDESIPDEIIPEGEECMDINDMLLEDFPLPQCLSSAPGEEGSLSLYYLFGPDLEVFRSLDTGKYYARHITGDFLMYVSTANTEVVERLKPLPEEYLPQIQRLADLNEQVSAFDLMLVSIKEEPGKAPVYYLFYPPRECYFTLEEKSFWSLDEKTADEIKKGLWADRYNFASPCKIIPGNPVSIQSAWDEI